MKTANEAFEKNIPDELLGIMDDYTYGKPIRNCVEIAMKQYAVEAINELVDSYLEYPPKQGRDIIEIANRIKRGIHRISIMLKDTDEKANKDTDGNRS